MNKYLCLFSEPLIRVCHRYSDLATESLLGYAFRSNAYGGRRDGVYYGSQLGKILHPIIYFATSGDILA
jgi:hypothetical protein